MSTNLDNIRAYIGKRVVTHGLAEIYGVQRLYGIAAVNQHLAALHDQGSLGIGYHVGAVHLHERRLDEESGFSGAGTADDDNVFVPGILGNFRTALHREPLCLCQGNILEEIRMDEGLDVIGIAP